MVLGTLLYSFSESFIGMTRDYVCRINCETTLKERPAKFEDDVLVLVNVQVF